MTAFGKLLHFTVFLNIIFNLQFNHLSRTWTHTNTHTHKKPGVIPNSIKKDLKYDAATVTSISSMQHSASYNDTKAEVLIWYIKKKKNQIKDKNSSGWIIK